MVVLLNILVPVVTLVLFFAAYKFKKYWPALVAVAVLFIYPMIQPSYMPKGTVKSLPNAEFQVSDAPVVDLALKPKSSELYDAEREAAMERIDQSIKMQIEMNKQIKTEKE